MFRPFVGAVAASAMLFAGSIALAQGVITVIKTPPSQHSDTYTIPMAIHGAVQPPGAGWAGGRMSMHVADNTELDVLGIGPSAGMTGATVIDPFGPQSNNSVSVTKFFTGWHPSAPFSGINVPPFSQNLPLLNVAIHVKNSTGANSDVDATLGFWNIWHIRDNPTPGSTIVPLDPSDYILVRDSIQDIAQLHNNNQGSPWFSHYQFPTNPANPDTGHWLHVPPNPTGDPYFFHLTGGPGSQYYATFLNFATLGIEHVPEPTSVVLLAAGALCTVIGTIARRRRRKVA